MATLSICELFTCNLHFARFQCLYCCLLFNPRLVWNLVSQ